MISFVLFYSLFVSVAYFSHIHLSAFLLLFLSLFFFILSFLCYLWNLCLSVFASVSCSLCDSLVTLPVPLSVSVSFPGA